MKETTEGVSTTWEPFTSSFFFLKINFPMNKHVYLLGQIYGVKYENTTEDLA